MTLNARAASLVERLVSDPDTWRIAVHSIEGGGRYIDCGIEARGGLLTGVELARICLAGLADIELEPGEVDGRPVTMIQVVTDHPVRACLASQYAGWAIKEGKYFAMGSGPMRAAAGTEAIYDAIGYREAAAKLVVGRPRSPQAAAARGRREDRGGLRRRAFGGHAARRPDRQPGRRRADRRPVGRDGPAQAGRARVRPLADRLGPRHGPPAPGRRRRPRRDRPHQRRHPLRRPRGPLRHGRRRQPRVDRSRRCRPRPRATTATRSPRSSRGTITTSTPSIPTSSARPRWCSRISRPAAPRLRPARAGRTGPVVQPMKTLAALVSGFGWHVADLQRAAERLDVVPARLPFAEVSASLARAGRCSAVQAGEVEPDGCRRRPGADDAAGQPRTGRLPHGCPAPGRRGGRPGPQSPAAPSRRRWTST